MPRRKSSRRKSRCNSGKKSMKLCKTDGCTWVPGSRASGRKGYCKKPSKLSSKKPSKRPRRKASPCHSKKSADCRKESRCQYRKRSRTRSGRVKRKSVCAKQTVYRGTVVAAVPSDSSIIYRARRRSRAARKCAATGDAEEGEVEEPLYQGRRKRCPPGCAKKSSKRSRRSSGKRRRRSSSKRRRRSSSKRRRRSSSKRLRKSSDKRRRRSSSKRRRKSSGKRRRRSSSKPRGRSSPKRHSRSNCNRKGRSACKKAPRSCVHVRGKRPRSGKVKRKSYCRAK